MNDNDNEPRTWEEALYDESLAVPIKAPWVTEADVRRIVREESGNPLQRPGKK